MSKQDNTELHRRGAYAIAGMTMVGLFPGTGGSPITDESAEYHDADTWRNRAAGLASVLAQLLADSPNAAPRTLHRNYQRGGGQPWTGQELAALDGLLIPHLVVLLSLFRHALHEIADEIYKTDLVTGERALRAVSDARKRMKQHPLPLRIQLSRQAGWRLPEGARSVARPTRWGNPHAIATEPYQLPAAEAVAYFERDLLAGALRDRDGRTLLSRLPELTGRSLACWCRSGEPCHADLLTLYANSLPGSGKPTTP